MRKKIKEQLRRIEDAENIKILLAVESGSRAWGFASPDSDYDVRFVYIRSLEDYLRLDAIRDVIELPIDDVLDINGSLSEIGLLIFWRSKWKRILLTNLFHQKIQELICIAFIMNLRTWKKLRLLQITL